MDTATFFIGVIWAIYLIFLLPIYLFKEKQDGAVKAVRYKMALSGTFSLIGACAVILRHDSAGVFAGLILIGLVFAMAGDYFLAFVNVDEKKFLYGILCFGITQIAYLAGMASLEGFGYPEFILAAAVVIPVISCRLLFKIDMGKMAWPLSIYSALVALMALKALWMLFSKDAPLVLQWMFSCGALLFMVSDIFLGVRIFIRKNRVITDLVACCYFLGQLMIATAVFYQK